MRKHLILLLSMPFVACINTTKQFDNQNTSLTSANDSIEHQKIVQQIDSIKNSINTKTKDKTFEIYCKLYEQPQLYRIINDNWPGDDASTEATYNVIRNNKGTVLAVTEIPFSQSGDWSMDITHYFDKSGNTILTERNLNEFYGDADYSVFKTGELYHQSLQRYFDKDFNKIKESYKLTDDNDKILIHPDGNNTKLMNEFKDYPNYNSLIKDKKLDFVHAKKDAIVMVTDYFFPETEDIDMEYFKPGTDFTRKVRIRKEDSSFMIYSTNSFEGEPISNSIERLIVQDNQILCEWENNWNRITGESEEHYDPLRIILKMPAKGSKTTWKFKSTDIQINNYVAEWDNDIINDTQVPVLKVTKYIDLRGKRHEAQTVDYYAKGIGLYKSLISGKQGTEPMFILEGY